MNVRSLIMVCLLVCSAYGERPYRPTLPEGAELYSWRTEKGEVIFGLRINNTPLTAEMLMDDKRYYIKTQKDLNEAFEKLGIGEVILWRHLNQKGKICLPPEEVEVETKETALKSQVKLSISDESSLEPEYWNQPRGRYEDAVKKLSEATRDSQRIDPLRTAAKEAFKLGLYPEAKKYARELEALLPNLKEDLNYGDAVQDYNIVLGRVSVAEGDLNTAKGFLLGAGYTPGSPVLNTLGPNMVLARDILNKGERQIVLDYLDLCRNFWKTDHGLIDQWTLKIKNGGIPDFGSNISE